MTTESVVTEKWKEDDAGEKKKDHDTEQQVVDDGMSLLLKDEDDVRERAQHNMFYLLLMNTYSTVLIFAGHLISLESLVSIALSVGTSIYLYYRIQHDAELKSMYNGSVMSWTLLSFAIITPISAAVAMAFRRRELALTHVITIRATLISLYTAHAIWDWEWKKDSMGIILSGRERVREDFVIDWSFSAIFASNFGLYLFLLKCLSNCNHFININSQLSIGNSMLTRRVLKYCLYVVI